MFVKQPAAIPAQNREFGAIVFCYFEPHPLKWERKYDLPPGPCINPHCCVIGQLQ
jgi:hypothetical protein